MCDVDLVAIPSRARLLDLTFAFVTFRDSLSLPFVYLLFHYFLNVNTDELGCPYGGGAFGLFLGVQLALIVTKRMHDFFVGQSSALWWRLEVGYALYMYVWGTAMFVLAKPEFYAGAVTNNPQCDLYHHPMAQTMWIASEITCSGGGMGLLLLLLAWARGLGLGAMLTVLATQAAVAFAWFYMTVENVAPRASALL